MTRRLPCPAAPGPLEGYAARFDDLFHSLAPAAPPGTPGTPAADGAGRGRAHRRGAASGGAAAAVLLVGVAVGSRAGQCPQVRTAADRSGDRVARGRGAGDR